MVQRVLAKHGEVATVSEPWFLLPVVYSLKSEGVYTQYSHESLRTAIDDYCAALPNGREDYHAAIREFALGLYEKAAGKPVRYFLDKTPRYHLIVREIMEIFPGAKYIFLWRNPLAIAASIMETFRQGRWNLYLAKMDLYEGLANLIEAWQTHSQGACAVKYEDLIAKGEPEWRNVFQYLGLDFRPELISTLADSKLQGRLGDPTGPTLYQSVSKEPLEKWKATLNNPIRKAWCRKYIRWIGKERLAVMGYDYAEMLAEIKSVPTSGRLVFSDAARIVYGNIGCLLEPQAMRYKLRNLAKWHRVYGHS